MSAFTYKYPNKHEVKYGQMLCLPAINKIDENYACVCHIFVQRKSKMLRIKTQNASNQAVHVYHNPSNRATAQMSRNIFRYITNIFKTYLLKYVYKGILGKVNTNITVIHQGTNTQVKFISTK